MGRESSHVKTTPIDCNSANRVCRLNTKGNLVGFNTNMDSRFHSHFANFCLLNSHPGLFANLHSCILLLKIYSIPHPHAVSHQQAVILDNPHCYNN